MAFAYYKKLSAKQKRIYDRSDAVSTIRVHGAAQLRPLIDAIAKGLKSEKRRETEIAAGEFTKQLLSKLRVSLVDVKVLSKRPTSTWGELHGLYDPTDGKSRPLLTVWMRTAQRKNVVAFKTFLRTLLHEIGHHLDYQLLGLEDSLHTQGFYKRESSFFHQLVPDPARYDPVASRSATKRQPGVRKAATKEKPRKAQQGPAVARPHKEKEPVQGSLFD